MTMCHMVCGAAGDFYDLARSPFDEASHPILSRIRRAVLAGIAASKYTKPYAGPEQHKLNPDKIRMHVRQLKEGRWSTPGVSPFHHDQKLRKDFDVEDADLPPGVLVGARLCVTVECANVTEFKDLNARFLVRVVADGPGAGIAMSWYARAPSTGTRTFHLHAGGTRVIDEAGCETSRPLPQRIQHWWT